VIGSSDEGDDDAPTVATGGATGSVHARDGALDSLPAGG
jgi:hypothetical protein